MYASDMDRRPPLEEIFLEVTHACPMSCVHCSSFRERERRTERDAYIPSSVLRRTLESFARCGGRTVVFSGGEPLLHPDLLTLIKYSESLDLEVRLFSSGLVGLLVRELGSLGIEAARQLKSAGLKKIEFNLQGASRETHERITRTKRSFELVIQSIANARDAGLRVGIHFVPMRENYREFEKLLVLARDMQVESVSVLRFVPQGRGQFYRNRLEMTVREFFEFGIELARLRREVQDVHIRAGCPMNPITMQEQEANPVKCGAAKTTSVVLSDGNVVPCAALKQAQEFVGGNIFERDFAAIWREARVFKELRDLDHLAVSGDCPRCRQLAQSAGLCHAQRHAASGSLYHGHDPHCPSSLLQISSKSQG